MEATGQNGDTNQGLRHFAATNSDRGFWVEAHEMDDHPNRMLFIVRNQGHAWILTWILCGKYRVYKPQEITGDVTGLGVFVEEKL